MKNILTAQYIENYQFKQSQLKLALNKSNEDYLFYAPKYEFKNMYLSYFMFIKTDLMVHAMVI